MKYIAKVNDINANQIIDSYLAFAEQQPWYSASELYRGFWGSRGKHKLINSVLLPEQNNQCCYCQKHISGHTNSTIEHIIRQNSDRSVMARYFKHKFLGLNSNNICYTEDYVGGTSAFGQYPHKVAYHNFAIACSMCNSARGHHEIDPPFLFPDIEQKVVYDSSTGEMMWLLDPEVIKIVPTERPTVEKVNLNSSLLKAIRSVWFYGKRHPHTDYSTPDTVKTEKQKQELVYEAFGEAMSNRDDFDMDNMNAYLGLLTPHFWNETLKYSYFGNI